jgi:hopanoid biosynthesis associated protein HpnK
MLKLIVHADDFGLSEGVNAGIMEAYQNGTVTSTSIVANGVAFDHAVNLWKTTSSLDVGVHLTLVEEQPVLLPQIIPSLVNETGRFWDRAIDFAKRYFTGRIRNSEVRAELEAQIRKVLSCGLPVSHLDSHQHLHTLPGLFKITTELAIKFGIPAIRVPRESLRVNIFGEMRLSPRFLQLAILRLLCVKKRSIPILQTDHFAGFLCGGRLNKANLEKLIERLPSNGTCELMCHPGLDDSTGMYSHWKYHWSEELTALTDPEIIELIAGKGIQPISYRDLVYCHWEKSTSPDIEYENNK